jgi:peptidoglycan-associated lipoprotein
MIEAKTVRLRVINAKKQRKMFARYKSSHQILCIMFKSLRLVLTLLLAAFVLTGCRKQPPTPVTDGGLGSGSELSASTFGSNDDLIPSMNDSSWANPGDNFGDVDLIQREDAAGISAGDNTYNGRPMVRGVIQDVYFGFDSSSIAASERYKLQAAADYLAANPNDGLLIEGYCDWYGTQDYNLALGERRANSARDYLATLGVSTSRIDTLSKGSLQAKTGLSKSESGQDRRDELIILK